MAKKLVPVAALLKAAHAALDGIADLARDKPETVDGTPAEIREAAHVLAVVARDAADLAVQLGARARHVESMLALQALKERGK